MNIKNVVVSLILGVGLFVVGGALGILSQGHTISVPSNAMSQPSSSSLVAALNSRVIPFLTAYGQVTKIDGSNITLASKGDSLTVSIDPSANLYAYIPPTASQTDGKKNTTSANQKISLSYIRLGDTLNINLKVLPNGQLSGSSVLVVPNATQASTKK